MPLHSRSAARRVGAVTVAALLSGFTAVVGLAPAAAEPDQEFDRIHGQLMQHGSDAPLMIAAHRGQWRAAPENSLAAIDRAIADGAEIVEIDVRKTRDGALVLMHDDTVDRTTDGIGKVSDLTLAEIRDLHLKVGLGGAQAAVTDHRVPTFTETMKAIKGRALVNLDKGWDVREDMYAVLEQTDTVDHGLFKGSPTLAAGAEFMAAHADAHYIHLVDDANASDIGAFPGRQPVAYEVLFDAADDPQVQPEALATIESESRVWINSMWYGLAMQYTDESSLRDEDLGWATLVEGYGASMIQTDNVEALDYWRGGGDLDRWNPRESPRPIRIQAEDYAPGGEGVGYHDLDDNRCTIMRPDEGVDICDQDGAIAVNWIRGGEWIRYSITVERAGRYQLSARVSSPYDPAGTVTTEWDGAAGRPVEIRNTTSHRAFELQRLESLDLTAGEHDLVLRMDEDAYQNFNLDYLQLDRVTGRP